MTLATFNQRFLQMSPLDSDQSRRQKLLNILVLGITGITATLLIVFSIRSMVTPSPTDYLLFISLGIVLLGSGIVFAINNRLSTPIASLLFTALMFVALINADSPSNLAQGRSIFFFIIPIILTAVLFPPNATFIGALAAGITVIVIATLNQLEPNLPAVAGFFVIALISWLSSRSLDRALHSLRDINVNLDQKVKDRTNELYEALLQVSQESAKTQAILNSASDGIVVLDHERRITTVNPAFATLLKTSTAKVINQPIAELMQGHVSPSDQQQFLDQILSNAPSTTAIQVDWGELVFSITYAPIKEPSGEPTNSVLIFREITEEAQLRRMKDSLMSMASHEMRTPLNAIIGYSDMLISEALGNLNEEQHIKIKRIFSNGNRMLWLVNNLLDAAAIQAGHITMQYDQVSIPTVVDDIVDTLSVLAEQKGLALRAEIDPKFPTEVISDNARLHQILVNLTANAIKFTSAGSVTIRAKLLDSDRWSFQVSDTGIGIPKNAQGYIFDPFRQVDDSVRRKHQGSGLGLNIVKELTDLLNGTISLESTPDVGTTFTITFPLAHPAPAA